MTLQPNEIKALLSSDEAFDALFAISIQNLSQLHWTPLEVACKAARFLAADEAARVIDIGAGAGKFCMAGSMYTPGIFTGIEQRRNFVTAGKKVIKQLGLTNVSLIHGNFIDMDLQGYTGIYFFNSFHENLVFDDALDKKVELSTELFEQYTAHLHTQLRAMPVGTRLATYWLTITEIPPGYKLVSQHFKDLLKCWVKER